MGVAELAGLQHGVAGQIERAVVGDGAGGDGRAVQRQRPGALDRDAAAAGVVQRRDQVDQQRPGHVDVAGVGDGLVVQRIAGAAGVDLMGVGERAVLQHRRAGQIERAVVGDEAGGDRGAVQRQRAGALDRDAAAAGVVDGAGVNEQRAGNIDIAGVGDGLVKQLVAAAAGVDLTGIAEMTVLQEVVALKLQRTVDGNGAPGDCADNAGAVEGIGAQRHRRAGIDGDLARSGEQEIGDVDEHVERATLDIDRPGIGDAAVALKVTTLPEIDRTGVHQHALVRNACLIQQLHLAAADDRDGSRIVKNRIGAEIEIVRAEIEG